jgi:hypothetical protein
MQSIDFVLETLIHFVKQSDGPPPGIPAHTEPDFEQELTWLCEWHTLTPIVLASLERLALRPQISRITLERIKALAGATRALTMDLVATAESLSTLFEDQRIDHMFFGDVVFPDAIYPDPALRPVERIDIMIREKDWSTVLDCCGEKGFRLQGQYPALRDGRDALLYYQHYSPCILENERGDRLCLKMRLFDLGEPESSEAAWNQATTLPRPEARSIGIDDQLIRSCLTYNITDFGRLLHAVDIGLILTRLGDDLDWGRIEERLRSKAVCPAVFFTIRNVVRWLKLDAASLGLESPGAVRKKIFDFSWHTSYDSFAMRRPERFHRLRFCLLEVGRWNDKLRFLRTLVSPKREWVSAFFGRPYRPWLKLKFVVLIFKNRVGLRPSGSP